METRDFDLIVFGGGNALTVATETAKAGWRVALVEKGPLGGTCVHRGCIPSKLLLAHASRVRAVREAPQFHVDVDLRGVDGERILADVRDYVGGFDLRIAESLPPTLTHYRTHGRFVDNRTVAVAGRHLRADRIVLATGSRPRTPPDAGLAGLPWWTSDDVFRLERLPRSLVVVGGGFIGCELAYFFHAVGVGTTIVQRGPELLTAEDGDVRRAFGRDFPVPRRTGTTVTGVAMDGDVFEIAVRGPDGDTDTLRADALLYAIGRVPNTDEIDVGTTDLAVNDDGFVESDLFLRTNVDGIWSLGDVAGRYMFTHAANHEAEYLVDQLLGRTDEPIVYDPMPHAVFTDPEIAGLGETEDALRARGADYRKGTSDYTETTKGRSLKEEHGLCKILVDPAGTILGCHIVGAQASVLLHEVIAVVRWRNDVRSLTDLVHIHPSLSEVVRGAARDALRALGS